MGAAPLNQDLGEALESSSFVYAVEQDDSSTSDWSVVDGVLGPAVAAGLTDSRQAICITDANLDRPGPTIAFVNDAYTDIFCCDPADVIGQNPRIGQGPLTNRKVLDRLRSHLEAGKSVQAQAINYRFDRSTFRLRWSIDPLRRDGEVVGFLGMMRDVTMDDRLRRRLSALDTLMARGRLVSGLPKASRDSAVADALSAALRPIVTEIGTAVVTIGTSTQSTLIDQHILDGLEPLIVDMPIGMVGSVHVEVHPDAEGLLDRLAIGELAEHGNWLLELGEPPMDATPA